VSPELHRDDFKLPAPLIANHFDKPGGNTLNNIMPDLPVDLQIREI